MITDRQFRMIESLAKRARRCLPELCKTVSGGRTCTPDLLTDAEFQEATISLGGEIRPHEEDSQMLTSKQLQLIHIAWRQIDLTEEQYRLLLHNVAGVASAKSLTQETFEDVMAVLEDMGFGGATYWRDKVGHRGKFANARMVHKIKELAADSRYDLPAICLRMSNARTDRVEQLTPREAWNVIEMFKASNERNGVHVDLQGDRRSEAHEEPQVTHMPRVRSAEGAGQDLLPRML